MAYADPLDPTTPSATALRSEGDDRIREAKAAIRERLLTVFQDLDIDPLEFIVGIIPEAALAPLLISTGKIQDAAVSTPKIADGAVTLPKIPDGILTYAKLLPAFGAKLVQVRKATIVVSSGQVFTVSTNTDYPTGLAVSGVSIDWACCIGAMDTSWPSERLLINPIINSGNISIRISNIGTTYTTTRAFPLSIYIIETLVP